jgi:glutathione-independent formaldehyde dehydrogenase
LLKAKTQNLRPGSLEKPHGWPVWQSLNQTAHPKMQDPESRDIKRAAILKVVSTNICGSDQRMVRGRTTAPEGMVLGHEITGEVIECGPDVENGEKGRSGIGAVQCRLRPLSDLPRRPYRRLSHRQSWPARRCLWLCRYGRLDRRPGVLRHGALCGFQPSALSRQGAGAPGPVGMAATTARILGAAPVMVGDMNEERLAHAKKVGFEPVV